VRILPKFSLHLKTAGAVLNLLFYKGFWRPLEIFTRSPVREERLVESLSGHTLRLQIWRPKKSNRKSAAAMIVYVPFVESGSNDPRLVNLACTFARAGFVVAAPSRTEDAFMVNLKDIDDVVSVVRFLRHNSRLNISTCGLFGISSYNGAAIAAAADPRIKDFISFVISFAGYYDIKNVLRFVLTGQYSYKDTMGTAKPDFFAQQILRKQLEYYHTDAESLLTKPEFEKLRRGLSPSSFVDQLKADFFIIHSTDDTMIPYTESMQLAEALKPYVPVHLILTSVFEHGTHREASLRNIRRHYLPAMIASYKFLYALLSKHL